MRAERNGRGLSTFSKVILSWGVMLVGAGCLTVLQAARLQEPAAASRAAAPPTVEAQRAILNKYCVTCHNQQLKTAGLTLDTANLDRVGESAAVWEKVAHMLRTGAMPPTGMPRPDAATYTQLASWLEHGLDEAAAASPNAGIIPPHRLNRTEYANAVHDLLDLEIPAAILPIDNSILGFDNIAGALSVSPTLLERYMNVARQVSRLAVGDNSMMVAPVTYPIESVLKQDDRLNEDLPFGARGVTLRHSFPLDGDYVIQLRLKRNSDEYIRGLGRHPQPVDVRIDGVRVKLFADAGLTKGIPPVEGYTQDDLGSPDWEKNALEGDAALQVRFAAKAGARVLALAMPVRHWEADEEFLLPPSAHGEERDGNIAIKTIEISGPYDAKPPVDSASRRKLFTCRPAKGASAADEERCATTILSTIARRAYRRPLTPEDTQTLLSFCRAGMIRGFDGCIQSGLERILGSPYFLFRVEGAPADGQKAAEANGGGPRVSTVAFRAPADKTAASNLYRIGDIDLASRLSFFLWSSIPDDSLLNAAAQGKLHEPAVLEAQVKRMLADPRSRSLVDNFAGQWLELRRLDSAAPVENVFPDFDGELRLAFKEETERFVDSMLREDRPIGDMLTANYSFVNERLARHYGIPNIVGNHFRRVTMPDTRVGLLGQGSILTVTSQANRTSPVLRGKFVLENILGSPVPPPPPNVPPLKPSDDDGEPTSVRAALEKHRQNPVCANCHARMDPWGFALENFDGIGAYRAQENYQDINTTAVLLDGTKLDGPAGVRRVLEGRRDQFVNTVSEKLLVYALGRPVEYYDQPALRKITHEAAAHDSRWSSVILGIVNSMPFQFQTKGAE